MTARFALPNVTSEVSFTVFPEDVMQLWKQMSPQEACGWLDRHRGALLLALVCAAYKTMEDLGP